MILVIFLFASTAINAILFAKLSDARAQIAKMDLDGNGRIGGSKKKAKAP